MVMASSRFDAVENSNSNSNSRSRRTEQQGPRPASTSLMVHEESRTIHKRKPVIIYMVSPKVIHVEASEFMSLVQRLTGPDSLTCNNSTSSSENPKSSAAHHHHHHHRSKQGRQFPLRVKARVLKPSRSETEALAHDQSQVSAQSPISPTLFLRDLCSPSISGGFKEGGNSLVNSQDWFLHGDLLTTPPSSLHGSHNYLDIFSQEHH